MGGFVAPVAPCDPKLGSGIPAPPPLVGAPWHGPRPSAIPAKPTAAASADAPELEEDGLCLQDGYDPQDDDEVPQLGYYLQLFLKEEEESGEEHHEEILKEETREEQKEEKKVPRIFLHND